MAVTRKRAAASRHWGLKLIAILLAVALELYFYSPDNSVTVTLPATIEVRNLASGFMIVEPPRGEKGIPANIEVRGPRPLIEQLRTTFTTLTIDYPAQMPAQYTAVIDPDQLQLPSGVEVLGVSPATVELKIEPVIGKQLVVTVDHFGEPGSGYEVDEIKVFPETVVVRGPQTIVDSIRAVETRQVDISGAESSLRKDVSLKVPGQMVSLGVTMVTVDVQVVPRRDHRELPDLRVDVIAPNGYGATVEPARVQAIISGPAAQLSSLDAAQLKLFADVRSKPTGVHMVELEAKLPEGFKLVRTVPEKVRVSLSGEHG